MTNTNERPAEEEGEWETDFKKTFGNCGGYKTNAQWKEIVIFIRTLLSRTRKEAEEKGYSAALDEAIGVVKDAPTKAIPTTDEYANGWNNSRKETKRVILSSLTAMKGKGLNGMIGT